MEKNRHYEILAPVGDEAMFEASLAAGADAVYLAGAKFGARAYASNFDSTQLNYLINRAHKHGVKVFVTVNTLVKDSEFDQLYEYLLELSKIGPDALIIQDIGVYQFIKEYFPKFKLHASTQMTVNDLYGAKFLEILGFERLVIGREVPLEEIAYISKNTSLDIEVFVHGSLCVSVSGQCLMSSLIGQRSGNRGRCAQPCRKTYDLVYKGNKKLSGLPESFLSAGDLMTIENINDLIEAGVYSLKIEGRMKKPDYVYSVVQEYKKAIKGEDFDPDRLQLVSNRNFTRGFVNGAFGRNYYNPTDTIAGLAVGSVNNRGRVYLDFNKPIYKGDVISVYTVKDKLLHLTVTEDYRPSDKMYLKGYGDLRDGSVIYKIYSKRNIEGIDSLQKKARKLEVDITFRAYSGSSMYLLVNFLGNTYRIDSDYIVEKASKKPISEDEIKDNLSRLGNSDYSISSLVIDMEEDIFLAKSKLNQLRRDMVDCLDKTFNVNSFSENRPYVKRQVKKNQSDPRDNKYNLTYEYFYEVNGDLDLNIFNRIYCHKISDLVFLRSNYRGQIFYVMPRLRSVESCEEILKEIELNREFIDGISITSLGDLQSLKNKGFKLHLEADLNVFNSYSLDFYRRQGIKDISLSNEMTLEEIGGLDSIGLDLEIIGYGRISQMLLKHCPASIVKNCRDDSNCRTCPYRKDIELVNDKDRALVQRNFGYSELLTEEAIDISNIKSEIDKTRVRNIRIVDRGEKDLSQKIASLFRIFVENERLKPVKNAYLGHYKLGVI